MTILEAMRDISPRFLMRDFFKNFRYLIEGEIRDGILDNETIMSNSDYAILLFEVISTKQAQFISWFVMQEAPEEGFYTFSFILNKWREFTKTDFKKIEQLIEKFEQLKGATISNLETMDDYIDRKELKTILMQISPCEAETLLNKVLKTITDMPSVDAVEVVRCKDCKYRETTKIGNFCQKICEIQGDASMYLKINDNDYCKWGEKE